jgi:hypothetical protein
MPSLSVCPPCDLDTLNLDTLQIIASNTLTVLKCLRAAQDQGILLQEEGKEHHTPVGL